jgi:hypothetical protein
LIVIDRNVTDPSKEDLEEDNTTNSNNDNRPTSNSTLLFFDEAEINLYTNITLLSNSDSNDAKPFEVLIEDIVTP